MTLKRIDVVAGIIYSDDKTKVLLSLRKPEQHQGNCWEFPGGKVETAESIEHALVRELDEELGIRVLECKPYCQIDHEYVDKAIRLHFWAVDKFDGMPTGRESQQLDWFSVSKLSQLKFPEANLPVVTRLINTIQA